jgi:23S rRNA (guanosine2251-2'-O)-methyltransferase
MTPAGRSDAPDDEDGGRGGEVPQPTRTDSGGTRERLIGIDAVRDALDRGVAVQVVLLGADDDSPEARELAALAEAHGARLWRGGPGDLRRMTPGREPARALAMVGPDPSATLDELLARDGAVWLLHDVRFPSNAGFVVRTAEVSGAAGVVLDGRFNHDQRSRLSHVSMGADRLLPVLWQDTATTLTRARHHGHRILALEDAGERAPWQLDLTGPVVFVVGPERDGLPAGVLASCDAVVRLPMNGFVPSYNLQAAVSAVALERLRQDQAAARTHRQGGGGP